MNLRDYFYSLDGDGRAAYAARVGTSVDYLRQFSIPKRAEPKKLARPPLMRKLAAASEGRVSYGEVLSHFYPCDEVG